MINILCLCFHLISSFPLSSTLLLSSRFISSHLLSCQVISSPLHLFHVISSFLIFSLLFSSPLISSHLFSSLISFHLILSHFISSHLSYDLRSLPLPTPTLLPFSSSHTNVCTYLRQDWCIFVYSTPGSPGKSYLYVAHPIQQNNFDNKI